MKKTEIATKNPWRKPSRIVALIAAIVLIASVVCAVIFGSLIPRVEKIAVADDSRYTSMTATGRDEYFYSTANSNIYRIGGKDEELEIFDLKAAIAADTSGKFKDLKVSELKTIYMEPGSKYLWLGTTSKEVIQLLDEDGKLSLVDYVTVPGEIATLAEHDGTLYVINRYLSFYQISAYDTENFGAGVIEKEDGALQQGYLYSVAPGTFLNAKNEETFSVDLTLIKNCSMLSVEVIEEETGDYLYIFYTDGLIRMSTDFSMNGWETELGKVIPEKVEAITADAAFREEARKILLNKKYDYKYTEENLTEEAFEKEVAIMARKAACEEYSEESGFTILDYNAATGVVSIRRGGKDKFDKEQYNCYLPFDLSYCGAAYDSDADTYYIVASDGTLCTYDRKKLAELSDLNAQLETEEVEGVQLAGTPNVGGTFYYSDITKKGYVTYANSNLISMIDFTTRKLEFTTSTSFDIRGMIQNPTGDRIFYFYYNDNEAATGHLLFGTLAIGEQNREGTLSAFFTLFVVIAVLAAIVLLFAVLCMFKKGFSEKFREIMQGFVKQWGIYACILVSMVLLVTFCYYPAIGSIRLSLFDYTRDEPAEIWNNFAHYKEVFSSGAAVMFGNMLFYLFFDLIIALAPPLIFAFFLTIMRNREVSGVIRTLLFIPGIIPGVATMMIWKMGIYGSYGVLNRLISLFGGETVTFLGATNLSRWSLVLMGFPFVGSYLIFYGAMMNVPDSYYEAAELDGITVRKRFLFIDIPLIFPQIKYVIIMTFIGSAQNFGRTYMIFGNAVGSAGLNTPIHELYVQIQLHGNYGLASAYATVLFVFLFVATAINMRMQQKDNEV